MALKALTPLQRRFVEEYLKDFNARAAFRRAGYARGKSQRDAWRTLNAPAVRAAIEAAQRQAVPDAAVDAERVIRRYAAVAFASIGEFIAFAPDGTLYVDASTIDPERLVALEVFDVTERRVSARAGGGRIRRLRVRLACKLKAFDALARHQGLFRRPRPATQPSV